MKRGAIEVSHSSVAPITIRREDEQAQAVEDVAVGLGKALNERAREHVSGPSQAERNAAQAVVASAWRWT